MGRAEGLFVDAVGVRGPCLGSSQEDRGAVVADAVPREDLRYISGMSIRIGFESSVVRSVDL